MTTLNGVFCKWFMWNKRVFTPFYLNLIVHDKTRINRVVCLMIEYNLEKKPMWATLFDGYSVSIWRNSTSDKRLIAIWIDFNADWLSFNFVLLCTCWRTDIKDALTMLHAAMKWNTKCNNEQCDNKDDIVLLSPRTKNSNRTNY